MRVRGLTLIELLLVAALLVALATMVLPRLGAVADDAGRRATLESMRAVRDAVRGTPDDPGYLGTVGALPARMDDLFINHAGVLAYNPLTKKGYRANGYLQSNGAVYHVNTAAGFTADYCYMDGADTAVLDGWNHPLVIQTDPNNAALKRVLSAGADGTIDTPASSAFPAGDDVIVNLYAEGAAW